MCASGAGSKCAVEGSGAWRVITWDVEPNCKSLPPHLLAVWPAIDCFTSLSSGIWD